MNFRSGMKNVAKGESRIIDYLLWGAVVVALLLLLQRYGFFGTS